MKTKQLTFQYEVERPTALVMPNDDQWHTVTLTVTATVVPSDTGAAEIAEIVIHDPDGDEFKTTPREREQILAAALEETIGLWEAAS